MSVHMVQHYIMMQHPTASAEVAFSLKAMARFQIPGVLLQKIDFTLFTAYTAHHVFQMERTIWTISTFHRMEQRIGGQ